MSLIRYLVTFYFDPDSSQNGMAPDGCVFAYAASPMEAIQQVSARVPGCFVDAACPADGAPAAKPANKPQAPLAAAPVSKPAPSPIAAPVAVPAPSGGMPDASSLFASLLAKPAAVSAPVLRTDAPAAPVVPAAPVAAPIPVPAPAPAPQMATGKFRSLPTARKLSAPSLMKSGQRTMRNVPSMPRDDDEKPL